MLVRLYNLSNVLLNITSQCGLWSHSFLNLFRHNALHHILSIKLFVLFTHDPSLRQQIKNSSCQSNSTDSLPWGVFRGSGSSIFLQRHFTKAVKHTLLGTSFFLQTLYSRVFSSQILCQCWSVKDWQITHDGKICVMHSFISQMDLTLLHWWVPRWMFINKTKKSLIIFCLESHGQT